MTLVLDLKQSPTDFTEEPFGITDLVATPLVSAVVLGSFFAYTSWPYSIYRCDNSAVILSDSVAISQERTHVSIGELASISTAEYIGFDKSLRNGKYWGGYIRTRPSVSALYNPGELSILAFFAIGADYDEETVLPYRYTAYLRPYSLALVFYAKVGSGMKEVYRHALLPGHFVTNVSWRSKVESPTVLSPTISFGSFRPRCVAPLVVDGHWLYADEQTFVISPVNFSY